MTKSLRSFGIAFPMIFCLLGTAPAQQKIQVTVVAILASAEDRKIDDRLKELAAVFKKKDPTLTGFELERFSVHSLKIGDKESFPLVDTQDVVVTIKGRDQDGCVQLLVKPPTWGELSYTCCCGKYFPVETRYETKDKKRLLIAIMVRPCPKAEKKKAADK